MVEADKKKRKVSKKNKKSWRKNVDTKDIDSFLENSRLEERLGVPFAKRSDNELFYVDSKPEEIKEIDISFGKTKEDRRAALKKAEPKCLAILKPHTAVPDPITKRNRVRLPEEGKSAIMRRMQREKKMGSKLTLKAKVALKNRELAKEKRLARPKRGEFNVDIWDRKQEILPEVDSQWFTSDTIRHTLANRGMKKKRIPVSVQKKPSEVPAVDLPHPGTSYNPSYEDHQELLREVADKELKLMKEEAHLNRVTNKMFKRVSAEQKDKDWLRESSEGLPLKPDEKNKKNNEWEEEDSNIVTSINPPVKNNKKTLVQRRKQKEQRKLALSLKHAKIEKKKVSDIYKLKLLGKNLEKEEKKIASLREKRQKVKERKAIEPKILNKTKFEPMEPVFKLGEELAGNLRNSDPSGNLLKDRFKSLQQRSIVAPSTRVMKLNKARVKRFEKANHKMGWEGTFK